MKKYWPPIIICASLIFLSACDVLTGKPEKNIWADIDASVWEATAPHIQVNLNADSSRGLTIPVGPVDAKQRIPFTVTYNTTNQEYAFTAWKATIQEGDTQRDAEASEVYIQDRNAETTGVNILIDHGPVTLTPLTLERPIVMNYQPDGGVSNPAIRVQPIIVRFSVPISADSFIWRYEPGKKPIKTQDGKFKNISILGAANYGDNTAIPYEKYFNEPELQGNTLVITANTALPLPLNSYIYVTLDKSIVSADTLVPLASSFRFEYSINNEPDTEPPLLKFHGVSLDGAMLAEANEYGRRIKPRSTVYLVISAYDAIMRTNLLDVTIREKLLLDIAGVPVNSAPAYEETVRYTDDSANARWTDLVLDVNTRESDRSPGDGNLCVLEYTIRGDQDGRIEFAVKIADSSKNETNYNDNIEFVYRDSTLTD
jgi:hypothetical protein